MGPLDPFQTFPRGNGPEFTAVSLSIFHFQVCTLDILESSEYDVMLISQVILALMEMERSFDGLEKAVMMVAHVGTVN